MIFTKTTLDGAYLIDVQRLEDERGFFARGWCADVFREHGLNGNVTQLNVGFSRRAGTLRGLHFQHSPHAEVKIVRCTRGAMYDVIVDLRADSATFGRWFGVELTAENGRTLYVPEGCAQGYQTLLDDTEMYYLTSKPYAPGAAQGVRFDDPAFGIEWPLPVQVISQADRSWPYFAQSPLGRSSVCIQHTRISTRDVWTATNQ
jgi:dTDP-4-dehydrorhamnose 3,5-epimerase